ncbi:hypothetical protein vBEcoMphAPEC6_01145 [Escherichia phage ph0011]|nr:hypothetical protein vBEcoMphAPEC6_01145 [Escherichia phage ph0011]
MLADDFMSLSTKIFDILGDEIDFHLNDTTIPFEDGGYFFAIGYKYNVDFSIPVPDGSDYAESTYFEFQFSGHTERLLTYRRKGNFSRPEIILMDFEKRIELAKNNPFISTYALNQLIELFDGYPDRIRGSLRINAE